MKNLVIVCGPTGIGKTRTGAELASYYHTGIISCDSRQVYRELRIGTAVPTDEELQKVPHHLIHHKSIHDYYNAGIYEQEALDVLEKLFQQHDIVFLVGGTGLYIDVILHGIDDLPDADMNIRVQLTGILNNEGIESLRLMLKKLDPAYYKQTDLKNSKRLLKALEVSLITGEPYSSLLTKPRKKRPFNSIKICLNTDRKNLYERINKRVDKMIENGLIEEARDLYPQKQLNALNTVGYKELFSAFENNITTDRAIELIKRNTRRYARRQITWFNRYNDIAWFEPEQTEDMIYYIEQKIR